MPACTPAPAPASWLRSASLAVARWRRAAASGGGTAGDRTDRPPRRAPSAAARRSSPQLISSEDDRRAEPVPVRDPRRRRDEADRPTVRDRPGRVQPGARRVIGIERLGGGQPTRRSRRTRRRSSGRSRTSAASTSTDVDLPGAGDWTCSFNASAAGTIPAGHGRPSSSRCRETGHADPARRQGPVDEDADRRDRGRHRQDRDRPDPDPSFYTTSVDEALAKHEPFVLVFATPAFCTSKQCGPTLDGIKAVAKDEPGITFINVEPYQLEYADGRLQPVLEREQPAPGRPTPRKAWGIAVGAVGLRGRRRRDRPRLVRGGRLGRGAEGGDRRRPLSLASGATARRRGGRRRGRPFSGPEVDEDRVGGRHVLGQVARARSRRRSRASPSTKVRSWPFDRPQREPLDLARGPAESTVVTSPTIGDPGTSKLAEALRRARGARRRRERGHGRRLGGRPAGGHDEDERDRQPDRGRRSGKAPWGSGPADHPVLAGRAGAAGRLDRFARGAARTGRGPRLVGRQVEDPQGAERVDPPGRGEVRVVVPPDRSTRTWQSTISPPAASIAGIIARSEPPVVRMSSTRMHPLAARDREAAPELAPDDAVVAADLLGEDRPRPQLAAGLEGQDHPAGRRAGDEVDRRRRRPGRDAGRPRSRTARSSRPCPGGPGTSPGRRRSGAPLLSRKWPSRRAPERRNSSSVRRAMAARAASSMAERMVVIAGQSSGAAEVGASRDDAGVRGCSCDGVPRPGKRAGLLLCLQRDLTATREPLDRDDRRSAGPDRHRGVAIVQSALDLDGVRGGRKCHRLLAGHRGLEDGAPIVRDDPHRVGCDRAACRRLVVVCDLAGFKSDSAEPCRQRRSRTRLRRLRQILDRSASLRVAEGPTADLLRAVLLPAVGRQRVRSPWIGSSVTNTTTQGPSPNDDPDPVRPATLIVAGGRPLLPTMSP